jgi:predicted HTH domain antitoxin
MLKPATVRVPEEFLNEISMFIKDMRLDKSAYLREILKKGFEEDRQERLLAKYQTGDLSAEEVCRFFNVSMWDFLSILEKRNISLNVHLKDWLNSATLGNN